MATSELAHPEVLLRERVAARSAGQVSIVARVLAVLASLRLSVVLFSLSIFLVFVGTLAQKDNDVWKVVNDTYFRVWVAQVDFQTFERLAQIFSKTIDWQLTGWFPFPGGKTIGLLLLVNLVAAHAVRFKVALDGAGDSNRHGPSCRQRNLAGLRQQVVEHPPRVASRSGLHRRLHSVGSIWRSPLGGVVGAVSG
jgi:hypothetical protein